MQIDSPIAREQVLKAQKGRSVLYAGHCSIHRTRRPTNRSPFLPAVLDLCSFRLPLAKVFFSRWKRRDCTREIAIGYFLALALSLFAARVHGQEFKTDFFFFIHRLNRVWYGWYHSYNLALLIEQLLFHLLLILFVEFILFNDNLFNIVCFNQ